MSLNTEIFVDLNLIDAAEYINGNREAYGADQHAVETIRENKEFRAYVIKEIDGFVDDYSEEIQTAHDSAEVIWKLYQKWAYNP